MSSLIVKIAIYGALDGGNKDECQAVDVTQQLQAALDSPLSQGTVKINNYTMGGDPSKGNTKAFAAAVTESDGTLHYFACLENQTIDFLRWKAPSTAEEAVAQAG